MPAVEITPADLAPFTVDNPIPEDKAEAMIEDALAQAAQVAPCILEEDFPAGKAATAKSILRGALLRWHESGQGALSQSQQTAGVFSTSQMFDTRQPRRGIFYPSEKDDLKQLCRTETGGRAWSYDTLGSGVEHADTCAINFGAEYCDCGAILAGFPLWQTEQP